MALFVAPKTNSRASTGWQAKKITAIERRDFIQKRLTFLFIQVRVIQDFSLWDYKCQLLGVVRD